jgi:murein DD-endopeptidase MepM/ murein hydrolase activator NlpD
MAPVVLAWRNTVFSEAALQHQENGFLNQPYFIVVLAHSLHGRLRRVHVPYQFVYVVLALALIGSVSLFGFISSYARMSLKIASYNNLRQEIDTLRERYTRLEQESRQKGAQLASLQLLANEVSVAYGIKQSLEGPLEIASEGRLVPTVSETLEQYNFLKIANLSRFSRRSSPLFQAYGLPSIWPVEGRLMSYFGRRSDPFSGEGSFHAGIDISVPTGTPVHATADGTVMSAEWAGQYGRMVVIDHGNGVHTQYAHMSQLDVLAGQWVRRGAVIGRSGSSGKSTGAHVHYEVRRGGTPVNPSQFLRTSYTRTPRRDYGF